MWWYSSNNDEALRKAVNPLIAIDPGSYLAQNGSTSKGPVMYKIELFDT